jgi:hypothetical protein
MSARSRFSPRPNHNPPLQPPTQWGSFWKSHPPRGAPPYRGSRSRPSARPPALPHGALGNGLQSAPRAAPILAPPSAGRAARRPLERVLERPVPERETARPRAPPCVGSERDRAGRERKKFFAAKQKKNVSPLVGVSRSALRRRPPRGGGRVGLSRFVTGLDTPLLYYNTPAPGGQAPRELFFAFFRGPSCVVLRSSFPLMPLRYRTASAKSTLPHNKNEKKFRVP